MVTPDGLEDRVPIEEEQGPGVVGYETFAAVGLLPEFLQRSTASGVDQAAIPWKLRFQPFAKPLTGTILRSLNLSQLRMASQLSIAPAVQ